MEFLWLCGKRTKKIDCVVLFV